MLDVKLSCLLSGGIILVIFLHGCSGTLYQGPATDHFDGNRFFNPEGEAHTFGQMLKWMATMKTVVWPEWINDLPQPKPVAAVGSGELRVTYINHATVLIQMDGLNILTDPIWSKRAGPYSWAGVKRVRAPGVALADLPKIDLILISHDH
jgi:hypothetical protein